jgi:tellurite resistance protein TerC
MKTRRDDRRDALDDSTSAPLTTDTQKEHS